MRLVLNVCEGVRDVKVDTESDTVTVFWTSSAPGGAGASGGDRTTGNNRGGGRPDTAELLRHLDDLGLGLTFVVANDNAVSTAAGDAAVATASTPTVAVTGGENAYTTSAGRRFKEDPATATTTATSTATTQTTMVIVLAVEGMMCQKNCGSTVHKALSSVPEVLRADVSFDKRRATVWTGPNVGGRVAWNGGVASGAGPVAGGAVRPFSVLLDALIGAVEAVGFAATVVPDVVLELEGMMCQRNCGSTIKAALEAVRGVRRAEVSFADGRGLVWSDGGDGGFGEGGGGGGGGRGRAGRLCLEEALVDAVEAVGFGAAVAPAVELEVEGMMCQKNCGTTVRTCLEGVSGVSRAEVSFAKKRARVWSSSGSGSDIGADTDAAAVSAAALVDAVEAIGFDAAVAPAVLLSVEGMMCQKNCGTTVRGALEGVSGVSRAEVSFADKLAKVWSSGSDCSVGFVSVGALVDAVEAVGFGASPASSAAPSPAVNGNSSNGNNDKMKPTPTDEADFPSSNGGIGGGGGRKKKASNGRGYSSRVVVLSPNEGAVRKKGGLSGGSDGGGGGRLMLSTGSFTVEGMSCAACVGKVERFVGAMTGVGDVRVALLAGQVRPKERKKSRLALWCVSTCILLRRM